MLIIRLLQSIFQVFWQQKYSFLRKIRRFFAFCAAFWTFFAVIYAKKYEKVAYFAV